MLRYPDIPSVELLPISLSDGPLRVRVLAQAPPAPLPPGMDACIRDAWAGILASNPRSFDGPILAVDRLPHEMREPSRQSSRVPTSPAFEIIARRERYARLAVQPKVPTDVRILSVTAIVLAQDAMRRSWVMLGKRSRSTRIYGGMWELGPSGGVQVPEEGVDVLDHDALVRSLAEEVREEAGLEVRKAQAIAITRDHHAMSDDIVFACDVGTLEEASSQAHAANWEYEEVRWLAMDSLAPFVARHEQEIIPPTRALLRMNL